MITLKTKSLHHVWNRLCHYNWWRDLSRNKGSEHFTSSWTRNLYFYHWPRAVLVCVIMSHDRDRRWCYIASREHFKASLNDTCKSRRLTKRIWSRHFFSHILSSLITPRRSITSLSNHTRYVSVCRNCSCEAELSRIELIRSNCILAISCAQHLQCRMIAPLIQITGFLATPTDC